VTIAAARIDPEAGVAAPPEADRLIAADAQLLSGELQRLRNRLYPPASRKQLRRFTSGEAARLVGVSDSYLRQLSLEGAGPQPETGAGGRRLYTLDEINALRRHLTEAGGRGRSYVPHRRPGEHCQVLAVTNFKGGSGKTTTAAHLAQGLALKGYRVLAVDLDPQASLSALFGIMPEFDIGENETLYAAIRYDDRRRAAAEVVRKTYFTGVDLIPANLELHEFEHTTPRVLALRKPGEAAEGLFFTRVREALDSVAADYDVIVIDCPPQLGFLTLGALCAASGLLVTVHPQMLDVASMSQFLFMTSDLLSVVRESGGRLTYDFQGYVVTRHEPNDGPQAQIVGFLRNLFGGRVLTNAMLKSTAVADAGLTKQTLYEVARDSFTRSTYDRAMESLEALNGEIEGLMLKSWGRKAVGAGS
jgi:chromosome partitioning protein